MARDRFSQIVAQYGVKEFAALPEARRLQVVRAAGAVPEECGDAIPAAPARGAVRMFDFLAAYPKGPDTVELKPAGHLGRRSLERLDVFGRMEGMARRRGCVCLTPSQIATGRMYRTLVEDRDAGAIRCASGEALMAGGSRGGTREGFTDHRLAMARRIEVMQLAIGPGAVLVAGQGGKGAPILARRLVDLVCLEDTDLSAVLRLHGWVAANGAVGWACAALGRVLDRMAKAAFARACA